MRACTPFAPTYAIVCVCTRARVCIWAHTNPRRRTGPSEHFPSMCDRIWLGAQAFCEAKAFNANIGAWNTASVTSLSYVCAASGPR